MKHVVCGWTNGDPPPKKKKKEKKKEISWNQKGLGKFQETGKTAGQGPAAGPVSVSFCKDELCQSSTK